MIIKIKRLGIKGGNFSFISWNYAALLKKNFPFGWVENLHNFLISQFLMIHIAKILFPGILSLVQISHQHICFTISATRCKEGYIADRHSSWWNWFFSNDALVMRSTLAVSRSLLYDDIKSVPSSLFLPCTHTPCPIPFPNAITNKLQLKMADDLMSSATDCQFASGRIPNENRREINFKRSEKEKKTWMHIKVSWNRNKG